MLVVDVVRAISFPAHRLLCHPGGLKTETHVPTSWPSEAGDDRLDVQVADHPPGELEVQDYYLVPARVSGMLAQGLGRLFV